MTATFDATSFNGCPGPMRNAEEAWGFVGSSCDHGGDIIDRNPAAIAESRLRFNVLGQQEVALIGADAEQRFQTQPIVLVTEIRRCRTI